MKKFMTCQGLQRLQVAEECFVDDRSTAAGDRQRGLHYPYAKCKLPLFSLCKVSNSLLWLGSYCASTSRKACTRNGLHGRLNLFFCTHANVRCYGSRRKKYLFGESKSDCYTGSRSHVTNELNTYVRLSSPRLRRIRNFTLRRRCLATNAVREYASHATFSSSFEQFQQT